MNRLNEMSVSELLIGISKYIQELKTRSLKNIEIQVVESIQHLNKTLQYLQENE